MGCSRDRDQSNPSSGSVVTSASMAGYWVNGRKDNEQVLLIEKVENSEDNSQQIKLRGLNLKPYTLEDKILIEPALLSLSDNQREAKGHITFVSQRSNKDIVYNIEITVTLSSANRLLVSHGSSKNGITFVFFDRMDTTEGALRFLQLMRLSNSIEFASDNNEEN